MHASYDSVFGYCTEKESVRVNCRMLCVDIAAELVRHGSMPEIENRITNVRCVLDRYNKLVFVSKRMLPSPYVSMCKNIAMRQPACGGRCVVYPAYTKSAILIGNRYDDDDCNTHRALAARCIYTWNIDYTTHTHKKRIQRLWFYF